MSIDPVVKSKFELVIGCCRSVHVVGLILVGTIKGPVHQFAAESIGDVTVTLRTSHCTYDGLDSHLDVRRPDFPRMDLAESATKRSL